MNKKILLTLILALVLSISCFASVVNAADDSVTAELSSAKNVIAGDDFTVTITLSKPTQNPHFRVNFDSNKVTYKSVSIDSMDVITDNANKGANSYVNLSIMAQGNLAKTGIPTIQLTFTANKDLSKDTSLDFTLEALESTVSLTDYSVLPVKVVTNAAKTTVIENTPTPTPTPAGTDEPTLTPTPTPTPAGTDESTPTPTPAQTGDSTAAEGPMPQTGVNILAVSAIVLATLVAGYIARKKLVK